MLEVKLFKIPMAGPEDISGLTSLIEKGEVDPGDIVALFGKTEGPGGVVDFSRGYAILAFSVYLSKRLGISVEEVEARIPMVFSCGCEGFMTPHAVVVVRREVEGRGNGARRFTVGTAFTRRILPEEVGTETQANLVAEAVRRGMADARIDDPKDVQLVLMKVPVVVPEDLEDIKRRSGVERVRLPALRFEGGSPEALLMSSCTMTGAASAFGAGLALGEIEPEELKPGVIGTRVDLYSERALPSTGQEVKECRVIVMGNSRHSVSNLVMGRHLMRDALDAQAIKDAIRVTTGSQFDCCPPPEVLSRVTYVFGKAGPDPTGTIRGRRHVLFTDIRGSGFVRGIVNTVIASVTGDPMAYVSYRVVGGMHIGPPDGGLAWVIARA